MIKRILLSVIFLVCLTAALVAVKGHQFSTMGSVFAQMQPPPTSVAAATVDAVDWPVEIDAIGTLEAAQGVIITADLGGRVTRLHFDGGETVNAGQLLLEQDTSSELTQLSAAESDLKLAKSNLDRVQRLYSSKVVSRSEYDAARSAFSAAEARADTIRTSLTKKRIVAPFTGRLGLRLVDLGQELSNGVPIVSLQSAWPMRVNFSVPQQALASIAVDNAVQVSTDAAPGQRFEGRITAIDTEVEATTRTVRVQASLQGDQPDANLLPGMFVTVDVTLPRTNPALIVPVTAISFASYGDSVFILEAGDNDTLIARQQFVQLGERRGDFVAVTRGLEAGQRVASEGVFKLRNGAPVAINDSGKPEPSLTPDPSNS